LRICSKSGDSSAATGTPAPLSPISGGPGPRRCAGPRLNMLDRSSAARVQWMALAFPIAEAHVGPQAAQGIP
jgi:hypothetical protein